MRSLFHTYLSRLVVTGVVLLAFAAAGCGNETDHRVAQSTAAAAPITTTTQSANAEPESIRSRATTLWRSSKATAVAGRDDVSPRMHATELLIAHHFASIVPDRKTALRVLGRPERETDAALTYVLSLRRPGNDLCRRRLEIQLNSDGSYGGFVQDENETCRSGHNAPA